MTMERKVEHFKFKLLTKQKRIKLHGNEILYKDYYKEIEAVGCSCKRKLKQLKLINLIESNMLLGAFVPCSKPKLLL